MENNILAELLKAAPEVEKMKKEIEEGGVPDLSKIIPLMVKLPSMLDDGFEKLSKEDQERLKPMMDEWKKKVNISDIIANAYNDK